MTTRLDDLMGSPAVPSDDTVVRQAGGAVDDEPESVEADEESEDLFDADALLAPARTSRLTLALVALLILVVGFLAGVEVQQLLGAT